ncbi:MAG: hypothetical protein ACI9N3_000182 [Colwellia sp.]|jgi:hypothetical protein
MLLSIGLANNVLAAEINKKDSLIVSDEAVEQKIKIEVFIGAVFEIGNNFGDKAREFQF